MKRRITLFLALISSLSAYCFAVPANDECSGAILLTVNNNSDCANTYTGTQEGATQSLPPCINTGYEAKDVWFRFVATATIHRIAVNSINYRDKIFEVYSGSCGSLTSIACVNSGASGEQDVTVLNNLVIGNTYFIRVYDKYANTPQSEFTICINTATSTIGNDECTGAINIPVNSTPNLQQHYSTYGATQSMPGCYGTAEDDIWFKFTATANRHKIWVSVTDDKFNPVVEVFTGSCGSLVSRGCYYTVEIDPASLDVDLTGLTPGTTYYYRVYGKTSNNVRTDISTSVVTMPPVPANDECTGAIPLTVNSDGNCTSQYTGTQDAATQSLPPCVYTGYEAKDVWFKFVATAASHVITVNAIQYRDKLFEVFSGNCGNLTSIACVNSGGLGEQDAVLLNNLSAGATYYIRVYDKYANTQQSEFTICVNTAASIINNDECTGAVSIPVSDIPNLQKRYSTHARLLWYSGRRYMVQIYRHGRQA